MAGSARVAERRDLPSLTRIYNHYVTQTAITFDVEPMTPKQRQRWLDGFSAAGRHRCLVAELAGEVCGYACSGRFGFESIGVLHEVGRKFDRYWDVEWFEKDLTALPTPG